jgi:hypothetical protein
VAGVKIEIDEEDWAAGVEGDPPWPRLPPSQCCGGTSRRDKLARFELWSAAINGISREKTPAVAKLPPSLKTYGATRKRENALWRTGGITRVF